MGDDAFPLLFGQVLDEKVICALQLRVAVDLFQDAFSHALLPVKFAHFVEDDGTLQPLPRHGLDIGPILGVVFDVGVDLRIHFRIVPKGGLVGGGGIAAGARWR